VNSLLVGLLGRLYGGDIRELFLLGRGVSFLSSLLTTLVLAVAIARRHGRGAGMAGAVLSVGSGPMFGFTVMVRSDALGELLGTGGFLLTGSENRGARWAGLGLLLLAIMTKQTAAVFFLAAVLAPLLAGRRQRGLGLLVTGCTTLLLVVLAVNVLVEPHFAASLVGEGTAPWDLDTWLHQLKRMLVGGPDLFVLPALGLGFWLLHPAGPRELRPAVLVVLLLAASLGLSGKLGADMNYYLSLRVAEALAVGTLWNAVHARPEEKRLPSRIRSAGLAACLLVALASMIPSLFLAYGYVTLARHQSAGHATREGRLYLRSYREASALARDPNVRLLTDSGLIDLYQGERAVFGDPFLFRTLVETGRLRPKVVEDRIDSQYYDLIITTHDLDSPRYFNEDFRLPRGLIERARARYVLRETPPGLFVYGRRGSQHRP
jgi:hypothetical protein